MLGTDLSLGNVICDVVYGGFGALARYHELGITVTATRETRSWVVSDAVRMIALKHNRAFVAHTSNGL